MPVVSLIGAPSSQGAYAPGQELAPARLRELGLLARLDAAGVVARDRGDLPVRRWSPDRESRRAQNVAGVAATIDEVRDAVAACVADGERALVLGGDCTVGLGTIAALGDPGVVYLDLHADMNVPSSTVDGALDWMGIGHALGLDGCVPEIAERCSLRAEQIVLLGFDRTQATGWEREQVPAQQLKVVDVAALAADPARAARDALAALPDERTMIAVHFDVDVVDFVDAPLSENTGRNVGVPLTSALEALAVLLGDPRVSGADGDRAQPVARGGRDRHARELRGWPGRRVRALGRLGGHKLAGGARASSTRELTPTFMNTLRRWFSTVFGLTKS